MARSPESLLISSFRSETVYGFSNFVLAGSSRQVFYCCPLLPFGSLLRAGPHVHSLLKLHQIPLLLPAASFKLLQSIPATLDFSHHLGCLHPWCFFCSGVIMCKQGCWHMLTFRVRQSKSQPPKFGWQRVGKTCGFSWKPTRTHCPILSRPRCAGCLAKLPSRQVPYGAPQKNHEIPKRSKEHHPDHPKKTWRIWSSFTHVQSLMRFNLGFLSLNIF